MQGQRLSPRHRWESYQNTDESRQAKAMAGQAQIQQLGFFLWVATLNGVADMADGYHCSDHRRHVISAMIWFVRCALTALTGRLVRHRGRGAVAEASLFSGA